MNAQATLTALADDLIADAAGVVLGISIRGERTVVASGQATTVTPMTADTLFDLASVTKVAATTTALMVLVSRGELTLDTRVSALLPGFAGSADSTVRDLLHHRAGLWEWQPLYLAPGVNDDANAVIDSIEPRYQPGSSFHYSDLGFMYLGRIVETVTGRGLADAITDLVLKPLQLNDTTFRPDASSERPIAAGSYGDRAERAMVATGQPYPVRWSDAGFTWREHELVGEANDGNCFHALGGVAGHAGLFSTVDDLLDLAGVLGGDGSAPWTSSVAQEFFAAGPDAEQALGFRRAPIELAGETHALLWHPGFTGCAIGFVPDLGLSIVLGSNRLVTRDPEGTPAPTTQLWQPLVQAAALLHSPTTTSSRTS
ncbi:MAG: serine hydrolase domain-containing protein [Homoserinimonas sp.]